MPNLTANNIKPGALNESQAAAYIGVYPSTMAEWRKEGIGPRYKDVTRVGKKKKRILYPVKYLNEWLDKAVETA